MAINKRLLHALVSEDPELGLRQVVQELVAEGYSKDSVYGHLETLLLSQRAAHGPGQPEEDAILDTMDAVEGWCHPSARLFPDERMS